jgi:hypothetical protein
VSKVSETNRQNMSPSRTVSAPSEPVTSKRAAAQSARTATTPLPFWSSATSRMSSSSS